ncbi:MAG: precorrin-3B C(17)-methyltransferase [Cyanobacteriota bacterium]|jgi:cobalt-precorrin 5A hydrolase / precorrin-3B C17-methyltransferase|nr:precorrin-3B C(17)-methyltransferase [Cyanobacteriota bacterium]
MELTTQAGTARKPLAAIGFSPGAIPLLQQLEQAWDGLTIRWPNAGAEESTEAWLRACWPEVSGIVAIGACGLVLRLVAPLLADKTTDPAVVVLDLEGRWVVPLLGSHGAGGDALAHALAALLGATVVSTGQSSSQGRLALDAFGTSWGWRRGEGDWSALMVASARGGAEGGLAVAQEGGDQRWQGLHAARGLTLQVGAPAMAITVRQGGGCCWHPPLLWLGVGCERHTSLSLLEELVDATLADAGLAPQAVAGLASCTRKGDEEALLTLAKRRGWPLRLYSAEQLSAVAVPHPSEVVAREMGTASVAEASALLAATQAGALADPTVGLLPMDRLLVPKRIARARSDQRGAATLAIARADLQWAPQRGSLHLVGSGPGALSLLTAEARRALAQCTAWVGYGPYLDLLEPLRRPDQLRVEGRLTEEVGRCEEALALARQGLSVALISSGDSGIYGMAGLALELWCALPELDRPAFAVHPGVSALQMAAARVGAPLMHDFCTISLSDRLTPWPLIERRLQAAADGDFVVALYNPRSQDRHWQLERARELLMAHRPPTTPVVLARQLSRPGESCAIHTLESFPCEAVDMVTLVLVGNSQTRVQDGRVLTPRGYLSEARSGQSG